MEIYELQNIWEGIDRKITESSKLNKEILRKMLVEKPKQRLNKIRLQSYFKIILPFVVLPVFFLIIEKRTDFQFIIGTVMYCSLVIYAMISEFIFLKKSNKIDFSKPVISLSKDIAELKKGKLTNTRLRYLLSPIGATGVLLMAFKNTGNIISQETFLFFGLVLIVFFLSVLYTFRIAIKNQFQKLNEEISELEFLEE